MRRLNEVSKSQVKFRRDEFILVKNHFKIIRVCILCGNCIFGKTGFFLVNINQ